MSYRTEKPAFYREFYQWDGIAVQGTWSWYALVGQSEYCSLRNESAGIFRNSITAIGDEYKWSNIYLTKGTYKITITFVTFSDRGTMNLLFGSSVLDNIDMYSSGVVYNVTETINFNIEEATTNDFRIYVNGKNASSSSYVVGFSRLFIEKYHKK